LEIQLSRKFKYFLASLFVTGWLFFIGPSYAWATDTGGQEQVVVSPAQQAVNQALATANTEVQQAIAATDTATATVAMAVSERTQAQTALETVTATVAIAQTNVALVDTATSTINSINLSVTPIDQSSQIVQDAKNTVVVAQTSINNIDTSTAQVQISEAISAKSVAVTSQANAQTELTQANIAIDNAQTAVNNLQATIGTTTNVLAGVDDAGIRMNLPFGMQMGGTLYNNVYVGSNATITFGVDQGWVYYQTPDAPSVSIAGWDWTTWSTGTGVTYSTTGTSLDIAWDVRPYPQQDASTQMVQIRFNADVNPTDGAWMANVTAVGPIPAQARFNYRETTNGTIIPITDTNTGSGFAGQISQGSAFTPYVDPNTSSVQAAVDAANATITQLNQSLSPVVAQNAINTSTINSINTTSLTNTLNSVASTKTSLQSALNTKSNQLTNAISNNIPTPAPILSMPVVDGTTVTVSAELPQGYTANTWFYQVITNDPNAENPYAGQTLNTDGAPESIQLTGLTEGATYTIRVANWSGPVSEYTETIISIPSTQSSNLTGNVSFEIPAEPPVEEPPVEEPPVEEPPVEEPPAEEPPAEEPPVEEPPAEEPPAEEPPAEEPPLTVEEIISVVENLIEDGNLTAADAEAVIDALMSDGEITTTEVVNLSEALAQDGVLTLAEKDLVADALVTSADGAPLEASAIAAAGLEYRDLPPAIPVEVRTDMNGNPVVITAEVASALLTLESPAALVGAIAGCFNPDEAIEGLTEEQKCEVFKALANIGADMSPQERQKAKEVLVAAVLVGQVILGSSILRIRG
jgi:rRNA processing protein Krr1/Pno1